MAEKKREGVPLVLVTDADRGTAEAVAGHPAEFDMLLTAEDGIGTTADERRERLVSKSGRGGCDYRGATPEELLRSAARHGMLIARRGPEMPGSLAAHAPVERVLGAGGNNLSAVLAAMLPHQWSKNLLVLDVLILADLYGLRVAGGAVAMGIPPSAWLLAFCLFLFLSLAMVKRYAELITMRGIDGGGAHARACLLEDAELLASLGAGKGLDRVEAGAVHASCEERLADPAHGPGGGKPFAPGRRRCRARHRRERDQSHAAAVAPAVVHGQDVAPVAIEAAHVDQRGTRPRGPRRAARP